MEEKGTACKAQFATDTMDKKAIGFSKPQDRSWVTNYVLKQFAKLEAFCADYRSPLALTDLLWH